MGTVNLVTRKRDGRQLALKRVNFADLSHEESKQTLLEVALLSRLRHPNIIEYVEHFHDCDDVCIVMEVAPDDVLKVMRRAKAAGTPLPEEQLLSILFGRILLVLLHVLPHHKFGWTLGKRERGVFWLTNKQFAELPVASLVLLDGKVFDVGISRTIQKCHLAAEDLGDGTNLLATLRETTQVNKAVGH